MPTVEQDPWLDDKTGFTNVDFSVRPEERAANNPFLKELADIANEEENADLVPTAVQPNPNAAKKPQPVHEVDSQEPQPVAAEPQTPPEVEPEPKRFDLDDEGSYAIVQYKRGKGYTAEAHYANGGKPEVFRGATKDELIEKLLAGKANATKKIRDLNRKAKLSIQEEPAPPVKQAPQIQVKQLSADEVFELKNKMQSDPGEAIELYVQKKYGVSLEHIVQSGQLGMNAYEESVSEGVSKEFKDLNPDYVMSRDNYLALLQYLAKNKIRQTLTQRNGQVTNEDAVLTQLIKSGYWTVKNLTEAWEELKDQDLVEVEYNPTASTEEEEEETPTPAPKAQTPPPTDPRIARTTRQPRASLGIQPSSISNANAPANEPDRLPSAEDLEDLKDDEVEKLLQGVRKLKIQQNRRNR